MTEAATDCQWRGVGPRPVIDPSWRTPTVLSLAEAAYQGRLPICAGCGEPWGGGLTHDRCVGGPINGGALDPVRLAVLADALEEAGCDNLGLLSHLRGSFRCPRVDRDGWHRDMIDPTDCPFCSGEVEEPLRGPHVRGCWAVDLVLGKE